MQVQYHVLLLSAYCMLIRDQRLLHMTHPLRNVGVIFEYLNGTCTHIKWKQYSAKYDRYLQRLHYKHETVTAQAWYGSSTDMEWKLLLARQFDRTNRVLLGQFDRTNQFLLRQTQSMFGKCPMSNCNYRPCVRKLAIQLTIIHSSTDGKSEWYRWEWHRFKIGKTRPHVQACMQAVMLLVVAVYMKFYNIFSLKQK